MRMLLQQLQKSPSLIKKLQKLSRGNQSSAINLNHATPPARLRLNLAKVGRHSMFQFKFGMGFAMIKTFVAVAILALALAAPAMAGPCQDDIAKIDAALKTSQLDSDQKNEVNDLRSQAVQLCGAGNEQEGLDSTAQAKAILNIE
jgi:hypothetical protein